MKTVLPAVNSTVGSRRCHSLARQACRLSATTGLMHWSKIEEIQGIQRPLSVDLNPCARAMRSTRQQSESVTQEQGGDDDQGA